MSIKGRLRAFLGVLNISSCLLPMHWYFLLPSISTDSEVDLPVATSYQVHLGKEETSGTNIPAIPALWSMRMANQHHLQPKLCSLQKCYEEKDLVEGKGHGMTLLFIADCKYIGQENCPR